MYQTVNNLAGQENHPYSDSCGFVETSKPPTNVLQKNIANRQTFYSSFVRKKHCGALSKLSSTKHRPGQDKSLKLTRSQKVQLNYFISSFRDYKNIKFEVSDLKESCISARSGKTCFLKSCAGQRREENILLSHWCTME